MAAQNHTLWTDATRNLQALGRMARALDARARADRGATRFAPSPTGHLHLGHAAAALCVHALGGALGLSPYLRVEDHDRGRARAAFEAAIRAELAWLGLSYAREFRQSDDLGRYAEVLAQLAAAGRIYGCDCPRKRLAELATDEQELVYDGRCRARGLDWRRAEVGVRFRMEDGDVSFTDGFLGPQTQRPAAQCGDPLLRDRHGNYTYQFAVVVDDLDQGIGLVVRGADLLASTGRQILLARALGRAEPPLFAHHPVLVDEAGRKLGKRFFSESLSERRARGDTPAAVIGEAAWRLGAQADNSPLALADALARLAAGVTAGS